jgi:hypothetical protein
LEFLILKIKNSVSVGRRGTNPISREYRFDRDFEQYTPEDSRSLDKTMGMRVLDQDVGQLVGQSVRIHDNQTAELVAVWSTLDDEARAKLLSTAERLKPSE